MPVLRDFDLTLDVDQVLRAQGADPDVIRARNPHLVEIAERALVEGLTFLEPAVVYQEMRVKSLLHERLFLFGGATLHGPSIARLLGSADRVIGVLCTIGDALERYASDVMVSAGVYGLALDGVGSAAVEAVAVAACRHLAAEAAAEGMQTTIPLSPGMVGWPVSEGQPQIFSFLDASRIGITLTDNYLMIPQKSLSMVLGVGLHVDSEGQACDYCTMNGVCRYQRPDG